MISMPARMRKYSSIFLTALVLYLPLSAALVNYEANSQEFVLETKQIHIPGYDTAFNPTIIRWEGSILMSFRVRDPLTLATNQIGFVWLDDDFNVISEPKLLDVAVENPYQPTYLQDPKLIACNGLLYLVYNNRVGPVPLEIRRMFVAQLHILNDSFHIHHATPILHFDDVGRQPREKNWVPFSYNGKVLLADTIVPHRIQRPYLGVDKSITIANSKGNITWNWGPIRGGTQALLVGGEYLSFFHSSKDMRSAHSPKDKISHYFMGAYTFKPNPPFNITRISPEPITGKDFYHGPEYKTWKPLRVVFPGGFIFDKKNIWVAYGKQDHEIWIVKLDRKGLFDSLIPVETLP